MQLNDSNRSIIKRLLVGRSNRPLRVILGKLTSIELATLFNGLNRVETDLYVEALIENEQIGDVLSQLPEPQLQEFLAARTRQALNKIVSFVSLDQAAYIVQHLDETIRPSVIASLPPGNAKIIQQYLAYSPDSAGRMMETEVFSVDQDLDVQGALEAIRKASQDYSFYYVYCKDAQGRLAGIVSLRQIATAQPTKKLFEIMRRELVTVAPIATAEEVAKLVSSHGFVAVPVVDQDRRLIGIVTIDDVLEVVQDLADKAVYAQAGLQQGDRIFSTVKEKFVKRLPWMVLNLGFSALASLVVSFFEETMSHLIILATLKNIVAGMGGNTAVQSLTVITRGLATGDFNFMSYTKAATKEVLAAFWLGISTGLIAGVITFVWKQDVLVSLVMFISMLVNSLVAGLAGSLIPIAFVKLKKDPALGSGVIVTTFTDVVGFFSFLGIAQLGLSMIK